MKSIQEIAAGRVLTGLEHLLASPPDWLAGQRLGLLCNPASVNRDFRHARELVAARFPGKLTTLFSPQHGFFAEKQDNMIESAHITDPVTGCPVYSLYAESRRPTPEMFADMDVLLVDLQDAGTRVYTFIYTLSYCMEVARDTGVTVVVLDRPNPVGGRLVEGNVLKPEWTSFVGRFPMPMRHGLTIGEIARLFNEVFGIGCNLRVIPMVGWRRDMLFPETGLPWVLPSPNLPSPASALVYPGQVIWEGTCVSEGRGTTLPFEIFGAPWLDVRAILSGLGGRDQPGCHLRPLAFEPTSNKWSGIRCGGFQIHVTDPDLFRPYDLSLRLLREILIRHRDEFQWKQPPYEYEFERMPIDLILGDGELRQALEAGVGVDDLAVSWSVELERFRRKSQGIWLY